MRFWIALAIVGCAANAARGDEPPHAVPQLAGDVLPLVKTHCVKCHGPTKREGGLDLSTPGGWARGGESGEIVAQSAPQASLLWQRIDAEEMPPDEPLPAEERQLIRAWIAAGAPGLPPRGEASATNDHWAFTPLKPPSVPSPASAGASATAIDRFLLARLETAGLVANPAADRTTLIRRVCFDLTGLPPTPDEIRQFLDDPSPTAYVDMVDRYLASPHYGERWGKYWLDAAGYADSNGYFNADTDRPLAYRYRDYVVRAFNADKPFDRFLLEQIAGDELAGFVPDQPATPEMIELLEATHFLRNGQDGSGESDGNVDEVRTDRYSALEATQQIIGSAVLGLTLQCAKCHDHKFEPITQRDYYQTQAVFFPAFNVDDWLKPNQRVLFAHLPGQLEAWEAKSQQIDGEIAHLRDEFFAWAQLQRPHGDLLLHDEFARGGPPLQDQWSATVPGDDAPAGEPAVTLDGQEGPSAFVDAETLHILETGAAGDRVVSTRQSFDWSPDREGEWIQVTFDLVDNKIGSGTPAERIAYFIALHDFLDKGSAPGGNLLIDGRPTGGASLHLDYPGEGDTPRGDLGNSRYEPGHNFGVRATRLADDKLRLEHLYDGVPDAESVELAVEDLPDGSFGFEYCCGRSFVVDNVLIQRSPAGADLAELQSQQEALREKRKQRDVAIKAKESERGEKPGKISCVFERSATPPKTPLLVRGNHSMPGDPVDAAPLSALAGADARLDVQAPWPEAPSSGRRLAWARWLLTPDSSQAALVARVQMNRLWQQHFGVGIVSTTENLGISGATPSHPDLLEYLAAQFVKSGWSMKAMHRQVLASEAYQRTGALQAQAFARDPDNRLLWRHAITRLDAEAMRDAILAVSGQLDATLGGRYVATTRTGEGEVLVPADAPGARRRSIYLQQRRTQMVSMLNVFDAPTIVFNCVQRPASTMPLQSLSLLNSDFLVTAAQRFAQRLTEASPEDPSARVKHAYLWALARAPSDGECEQVLEFVKAQQAHYAEAPDPSLRAWADFCQMLMASNPFLYVE